MHHADHAWKHLPVGHSQRSPQTCHVASQLPAQIRSRLHLVYFWVRKVRARFSLVCVCQCNWNVSGGRKKMKLCFENVIKTLTKQRWIFKTTRDINICCGALQAMVWQVPLWLCVFVWILYLLTQVCLCLTSASYYISVSLCKRTFNYTYLRDQSVCTSLCLCVFVPGTGCVTQERVCSRSRHGRGRWSTSGSTRPRWPSLSSMREWWRRWRRAPRYIFHCLSHTQCSSQRVQRFLHFSS